MCLSHACTQPVFQAKKPAAGDGAETPSAPVAAAPAPKKLPPAAASKPAKGGAAPAPGALDTFKYKHTPEDSEALAAELIPPKIVTELGDSAWKVRLAALEEMTSWVEGSAEELDSEVVVRFLAKKTAKESNFQVRHELVRLEAVLIFVVGPRKSVWDLWNPRRALCLLRSSFCCDLHTSPQ